jgi:putative intracellular protease/amidase
MSDPPLSYALLLFPQFEVLDVFGPLEALNTLIRIPTFPHSSTLSLSIIAKTLDPVSCGPISGDPKPFNASIAQSVVPTHTFDNASGEIDVLVIPGGFGTGPMTRSGFRPDVDAEVAWIREVFPGVKYVVSK